jgi:hypothetical protein
MRIPRIVFATRRDGWRCFILGTVIAVQIFGLHGDRLAVALVSLSAIAAWFLLPKHPDASAEDKTDIEG